MAAVLLLYPIDVRADANHPGARALIQSLMSPYCPGLLLSDCRSGGARDLRAEIEQRMASGETADAVQADLIRRYGSQIRTMPEFEGVGLLAWVGPAFFGLAGFGLLLLAIRTSTRRHPASGESATDDGVEPQFVGRLRDELAALD